QSAIDDIFGGGGTIGWSFSVSDGALDYLQAGQVLTQSDGESTGQNSSHVTIEYAVITMNRTKDKPVITSTAQSGAVTEIADNAVGGNLATLSQSGPITSTDAVSADTPSAGFLPLSLHDALPIYQSAIDDIFGGGGTIGWSFSVSDGALDYLQAGQVLTQ